MVYCVQGLVAGTGLCNKSFIDTKDTLVQALSKETIHRTSPFLSCPFELGVKVTRTNTPFFFFMKKVHLYQGTTCSSIKCADP